MSGTLSTTFEMASVELVSDQKVFHSKSLNGSRFARLGGYHQWRIKITFNQMTRSEIGSLMGFLVEQRGKYETFSLTPSGYETPQGNWNTSVTVSSVTNDYVITLAGLATSDADAVKAGDVFTIAGDNKVYMITQNAASDGSGNATVRFEPGLRVTPSGGEAVTHTGVLFTVELDQETIGFKRSGYIYDQYTIDLVEALA